MTKTQIKLRDLRDLPVQIERAVVMRYGDRLGPYGLAVYLVLACFAERDHTTKLSYKAISDVSGIGRTKVRETAALLAELGLVVIETETDATGRAFDSNRYLLLPVARADSSAQQGMSPHDTPMSPHEQGMSPHDIGVSPHDIPPMSPHERGMSPHVYIDHVQLDHDLTTTTTGATDVAVAAAADESLTGKEERPKNTNTYCWLRDVARVYSAAVLELAQSYDLAATQALYADIVGDARGAQRKRDMGGFVERLKLGPPPPLPARATSAHTNGAQTHTTRPSYLDGALSDDERRRQLSKLLSERDTQSNDRIS